MAIHFSEVLSKMKGSDLGPLLALTAQPDIISFAGGLPAPRTFPLKELTEVAVKVREEDGAGAMQYGPSLGFMGLRQAIADRMNRMYCPMGMDKVDPKNIMTSPDAYSSTRTMSFSLKARPTWALSVHSLSNSRNSSKFRPMIRA